jgi:hypothetical protein
MNQLKENILTENTAETAIKAEFLDIVGVHTYTDDVAD